MPQSKAERTSVHKLIFRLKQPLPETEKEIKKLFDEMGSPKSSIHVSAFLYVLRGLGQLDLATQRISKKEAAQILQKWVS